MQPVDNLLEPFNGYLNLEMWMEANEELENLPTELKTHPKVLLARLELLVEMGRWKDGVILGESLCCLWPTYAHFFLQTAYCLHSLKRTSEAVEILTKAPESFRQTANYFYNLACYETQLGNLLEAKLLLDQCFKSDRQFREDALLDPDLEPLWLSFNK